MEKLMDQRSASEFLGLSESTLERRRRYGTGPRFVKLGRSVRYRPEDLNDYVSRAVKQTT